MNGWYKTSDGVLHELEATETIILPGMDITELIISKSVKYIYCFDNKLTELIVPESVKNLFCADNQLTELIVPDDCIVSCDLDCKVITRTMFNRSKRLKVILK
jgi:hypothetical protein